ncbi:MAG: hypothetical protein JXO22_09065, partial [Phycisphaerae bacterium]|nr:hypothetical protein [Phycisphaerae bacterium]
AAALVSPPPAAPQPTVARALPGVCVSWDEKRSELAGMSGAEELVRRIWESVDNLGHMYVWHCLVSF